MCRQVVAFCGGNPDCCFMALLKIRQLLWGICMHYQMLLIRRCSIDRSGCSARIQCFSSGTLLHDLLLLQFTWLSVYLAMNCLL
ncbi:hypothetical protein BDA96_08G027200 [Sorghum bicolor]|uniref:Uncharacterized protein n=1 Tax=Sorghum bicolor TaxID=4558 RepID=A0A921U6G0_SORBI|nr:hypothetical protein BDA96_08G027200 [Sorghum bicolor]